MTDPNTVHLGGPLTIVADNPGTGGPIYISEDCSPGMAMESFLDSDGNRSFRKFSASTAPAPSFILLEEQVSFTLAKDQIIEAGSTPRIGVISTGTTFMGWLASGTDASSIGKLQAIAGGFFTNATTATAAAGTYRFQNIEVHGVVTAPTWCRLEVVGN